MNWIMVVGLVVAVLVLAVLIIKKRVSNISREIEDDEAVTMGVDL